MYVHNYIPSFSEKNCNFNDYARFLLTFFVHSGDYVQVFQYFSSLPVLHYLQAILFLVKIGTIFMNILYNTL